MSSRRLLNLVAALPDDSAFAKAFRDGDWSLEQYLRAATVNELRSLRVEQAAFNQRELDMQWVESPRQIEEAEEDSEKKREIREQILKQLKPASKEESDVG